MEQVSIEAGRRKLGEIVDKARLLGEPTTITRQGVPAAVVIGAEWYRSALDLMQQFAAGRAHP